MKKIRHIARAIDPETGDVRHFNMGHASRYNATGNFAPPRKSGKERRARKRREKKEKYAGCHPRPLFHTPTEDISPRERILLKARVLREAGYQCQQCGSRFRLTLDHIIPRSRGGGWHRSNLQCLCKPCNEEKADRMPYERAA
ncbi:HNH endonuclease [Hymenobacter sp. UYP22]|uniref:HNH endonuclease n=1 Tax=Hymenobacter sp. UYP22 TaxID=3156348 RepID=UPI003393356A